MKPSLLLGRDTHQELAQLLLKNRRLTLSGVSNETAKALLSSTILFSAPTPSILITNKEGEAEALVHWLKFFGRDAVHLPYLGEEDIEPSALFSFIELMEGNSEKTFVVTREDFEEQFPLFTEIQEKKIILTKGEEIPFTSLVEKLIDRGYSHGNDIYLEPGQYRRIGDVLDIFPIQCEHSFKISLSFDILENIQTVDIHDLSKIEQFGDTLELYPVQHKKTATLQKQIPSNLLLIYDDQDDLEAPMTHSVLRFTSFPEDRENHVHLRYLSILKFYTLTDFLNDVRDKLQQGWNLTVVSKRKDELAAIFDEENITHTQLEDGQKGAIILLPAEQNDLLPHSLQNPDLHIALLTDREIFSLKKAGKNRSIQKLALDFITSLVPGDFVVHMEHGIGHFEGMTQKEIDGMEREYLELMYAEGDKLFVPVDQADKLSKYSFEEGNEPTLTRLGTQDWKRTMGKVREETQKLAKELLNLYALRAKSRGHKYADDTKMQHEFEKAFPYQETPGQIKAIEDIKHDMEDPHPMDRLVCGDVGFGKTEVAMRAAFKAAQSGKQVAVVAPITILAQQHFINFAKRMEGFPVKVDMLSRFRSPAEQKETLKKLKKGDINIVIGTHRLIQKDVEFFNLGLVIVDEEQRFGVKQKERFKEMRSAVDILTLTATPIPRTLNLGLHKLRDISTITTPPPGRLPIITEVRKYSDALVRQAILSEKKRNGQSYILHNRVESIDAFTNKLRQLIPEASFIVGHGQLQPHDLEKRILAFKEAKYDVLVSSTIIENGIDLPNANTLIVNEAERFGLSQLYQLRGRVGRGSVQAYAYFLYHTQRLKDDAKKRLRAIVEACELGSGFQVAMRDLEIRGAGEILGSSQSGNMQTIGVSHYLRMLKAAMDELQNGDVDIEEEINVEILLPVEALIPSYYIPDEQEKISVYQKLAGSEDEEILAEFEDDLKQEFGELPLQVKNLLQILLLKMVCRRGGVQRVKMDEVRKNESEIVITLSPRVTALEIMQILKITPLWRISGNTLRLKFEEITRSSGHTPIEWLPELSRHIKALQPTKESKAAKKKQEKLEKEESGKE